MSSQFLSLEDAAKKLGISADRLVELRSQGKIRGFRDGASWKFPENELDRLADELAGESGDYDPYKGFDTDLGDELGEGGSGVLVDEAKLGSSIGPRSSIIGGDKPSGSGPSGSGTDSGLDLASDPPILSGSDVNLIAGHGDDSDVKIVSGKPMSLESDSDDLLLSSGRDGLAEIDSGELMLSDDMPAITHDSAVLDLAIEPNAGSTGPITDKELKEVAEQNPDLMAGKKSIASDSGLAFDDDDEDSGDDLIGAESNDDMLGEDLDLQSFGNKAGEVSLDSGKGSGMSSLEMLDDLDLGPGSGVGSGSGSGLASRSSRGLDVLSELDLLSADAGGSGLITGDSGNVLGSGGLGSSGVGSGKGSGSKGSGLDFDDALADDDDLVIADDEDDLVLGGGASDISVSGDSGINLMSPSDSGLSLESEPLDLAGSSISALDLGSEFGGGSGIGSGSGSGLSSPAKSGRGSAIDFQADEDFRLSPSGVGGDLDDSSQVIEIEDSSAFSDADAFGQPEFGDAVPVEAGFGDDVAEAEPMAEEAGEEGFGVSSTEAAPGRGRAMAPVYEVPFSIYQVSVLVLTLLIMCLGGMLMTDLMRNMWAYTDTAPPVSSLTDALISLANLDG